MTTIFQDKDILAQVKTAAKKRVLFLPHAINQMNSPERMISTREVRTVISAGVVVEDYPEDVRGRSCSLLGWGEGGRPVHVVCAPKPGYLAVITTYIPTRAKWEPDWITRKKG